VIRSRTPGCCYFCYAQGYLLSYRASSPLASSASTKLRVCKQMMKRTKMMAKSLQQLI